MKKTFLVMVHEINTTLRRKMFTIFAFGIPLVLGIVALIVMIVNRNAALSTTGSSGTEARTEPVSVGYVDEGNLINMLPTNVPPDWSTEYPSEAAAQAALEAEEISGYYVVAPDYAQTGDVTYVQREYSPIGDEVCTDEIEWVLLFNLLDGDAELAATVWDPLDVQVTQLASDKSEENADSWIAELFPNLMTMILYMVILLPAGGLVNALTDEKKNRVMEVLISSISPQQMIGGKILALGLLGLLQAMAWVGVMWTVASFGGQPLNIPSDFRAPTALFIWLLVYFLLGYAMYGALLAGVGTLAPDIKDTRSLSFIVMSPLIVVYMFLIVILEVPNGLFALAMSLFPLTSPIGMIARMSVTEVPLWQSALATVLQLLTAIFIVRLVARLFRAQHLLSGQPVSIRHFVNALLERA